LPQYPIVSLLKAEDVIFDPETGENRKIRYVPGEPSIFVDDHPETARMREPISFNNGYLFVDHTNPTLKKYLYTCNANGSNPHRIKSKNILFTMKDDEKAAQDKIAQVADVMDAVQSALKMPLNELVGYAKVLGVNTNKSVDEIRWDMKIQAEKNPTAFRSEEHTSELQSQSTISYAVFCLKKKKNRIITTRNYSTTRHDTVTQTDAKVVQHRSSIEWNC